MFRLILPIFAIQKYFTMSTYFITATDTGIGKTVVTGLLAAQLKSSGKNVITMKIAQTGCEGISEDIIEHRKAMGVELFEEDKNGTTCPFVFKTPASPHLAASIENVEIDVEKIIYALTSLEEKFETVIVEGVGGLLVPLNNEYTVSSFVQINEFETFLVTSAKLGSINHTLLSLEHIKINKIPLKGVIYNHFPKTDNLIQADSSSLFRQYLNENFPRAFFAELTLDGKLVFESDIEL